MKPFYPAQLMLHLLFIVNKLKNTEDELFLFILEKIKGLAVPTSTGRRISEHTPLEEIHETKEDTELDGDTISSGTTDFG